MDNAGLAAILVRASEEEERGNLAGCLKVLQEGLAGRPDDSVDWQRALMFQQGNALRRAGHPELALRKFDAIPVDAEADRFFYLVLSWSRVEALRELNQLDAAFAAAEQSLRELTFYGTPEDLALLESYKQLAEQLGRPASSEFL